MLLAVVSEFWLKLILSSLFFIVIIARILDAKQKKGGDGDFFHILYLTTLLLYGIGFSFLLSSGWYQPMLFNWDSTKFCFFLLLFTYLLGFCYGIYFLLYYKNTFHAASITIGLICVITSLVGIVLSMMKIF
jgi:hypothetical protein